MSAIHAHFSHPADLRSSSPPVLDYKRCKLWITTLLLGTVVLVSSRLRLDRAEQRLLLTLPLTYLTTRDASFGSQHCCLGPLCSSVPDLEIVRAEQRRSSSLFYLCQDRKYVIHYI
ncbi:uncharacterized protein LOC132295243 isoform X2 [Cornus florida]|uniref:uncharacterized protein LOC132295243 isoform X2 n=1 Tax=Cornus florida TaxID=4283 RepID=UPI0028985A64|nr:uncharacterized protein LOC132295243 isoform X2 [Cornus florida]